MFNADQNLIEKWSPVLDHADAPPIDDKYRKAVTARLLENQEIALREERTQRSTFQTLRQTTTRTLTFFISKFLVA